MTETIQTIRSELHALLQNQAGVLGYASMGIRFLKKDCERNFSTASPDDYIALFDGDPRQDETIGYQQWRIDDLQNNLSDNGLIKTALGRQWVVNIFAYWEHEFRPRLAAAQAIQTEDYKEPIFGDIRLMRNDILHNGGIADATERAKMLKWFSKGESIKITNVHVKQFMGAFNLLFKP